MSMPTVQPSSPGGATDESESNNVQTIIEAFLLADNITIVVKDTKSQDELRTKGFGEKEDSNYVLKPYEAIYLLYTNKLIVFRPDKKGGNASLAYDALFEILLKKDPGLATKFLIYRDLRSRGYVAKEGFGFGVDFRVYERGDYEKKPAKYVVFGINEGTTTKALDFATTIEEIEKMGKEAVIAVIERRGEIIYYKASKMHFTENKHQVNPQ